MSTDSIQTISWSTLRIEKLIGHGGYGDVYKGTWYGKEVAIKKLFLKTLHEDLIRDFEKEAGIMSLCRSAEVISLLGICLEPGNYAMVMDYMAKGSLYNVLHDEHEALPWDPIRYRIATDMSKGLAYLHEKKIVHRDLKSLNVLLDQNYRAKITDFGLAKIKLETTSTSTQSNQSAGTIRWLAPELLRRGAKPTFASDVYAAGMVLWELTSRQIPFSDAVNEQLVVTWINSGEQEKIPDDCPAKIASLIKRCWDVAGIRPPAQELVSELEMAAPQVEETQERSWHVDLNARTLLPGQKYSLLPASDKDREKVLQFYSHHPIPGFEIESVIVICNPALTNAFESHLIKLQERAQNAAFNPKWSWEIGDVSWRKSVYQMCQEMAEPYKDPNYPDVKLLPLWHGTNPTIVDSICRVGYANLSTTDSGFFGKGFYSAHEAEYAFRVYSKGALILNWVAIYSPYPVIEGDIEKLTGKNNYENYDAHFVPVVPKDPHNPKETTYYPCSSNSPHAYTEVVVFESAACLPCYLIELKRTETGVVDSLPQLPRGLPPQPSQPAPFSPQMRSLPPPPTKPLTPQGLRTASMSGAVAPPLSFPQVPFRPAAMKRNTDPAPAIPKEGKKLPHTAPAAVARVAPQIAAPLVPQLMPSGHDEPKNAEEQYRSGLKLYSGGDYEKAAIGFKLAADQGHAKACFKLGVCYRSGNLGVPKDKFLEEKFLSQAFKLGVIVQFQASAAQGDVQDQNHLGLCYQYGLGVDQDFRNAVKWLMLAANRGDPSAQNNLGLCFENGPDAIRNEKEAVRYYTLAANQGYANAQYNLAVSLEKGQGIEKNLKEAVKLYTLSANQGNAYAQNNLGVLYKKGLGVPQNFEEAVKWFKSSSGQGNANGLYNLAVCYEQGQGVDKDAVAALKYFQLAADRGDLKAKEKLAASQEKPSSKFIRSFTDIRKK